jgi:hypothetical protein
LNQLNNPFGIACDTRTGIFYIADRDNHRVVAYGANDSFGTVVAGGYGAGIGKRQLHSPIAVHFDASSNSLLIVNYGVHNIVRWTLGILKKEQSKRDDTSSCYCFACCLSNLDLVCVLDIYSGDDSWTLLVGSPTGISGSTSTLLNHPVGVMMDRWKNIYVADTSNHRVQFFYANQINATTIAGITASPGSNANQLRYPFSIVLDSQWNLYVSDTYNHRIQRFSRIHQ